MLDERRKTKEKGFFICVFSRCQTSIAAATAIVWNSSGGVDRSIAMTSSLMITGKVKLRRLSSPKFGLKSFHIALEMWTSKHAAPVSPRRGD